MPICGGLGGVKPATAEVQALCDQVKPEVEEKQGTKYPTYLATEYKTQTVAGTNYFIKVNVGDDKFVHVCIHKALPHAGDKPSLSAVQAGKTKEDEIVHFH